MMTFYEKHFLPKIIHCICSMKPAMKQREKIIPLAQGKVLEVGFGPGLNLAFYNKSSVQHIWGLDPSEEMWDIAKEKAERCDISIDYLKAYASQIPLENNSVDSVVITYTLCTIPDVFESISDIRRVLKPSGKLLFCEHGAAPDKRVRRWQNIINPDWKRVGGGCNLNRRIPELIKEGGFNITGMNTMYIPGWKPASYNYWGTAKKR